MLCRETVTLTVLAWHNVGNIRVRHMKYKCKQAFRRTCRIGIIAHKIESVRIRGNRFLALPYFSTLSLKQHDFPGGEGGMTEHKMCFGFVYNLHLKRFSL